MARTAVIARCTSRPDHGRRGQGLGPLDPLQHSGGGQGVADVWRARRTGEDETDDETVRLGERAAGVARAYERLYLVNGPHGLVLAVDVESRCE